MLDYNDFAVTTLNVDFRFCTIPFVVQDARSFGLPFSSFLTGVKDVRNCGDCSSMPLFTPAIIDLEKHHHSSQK